MQIDSSKFVTGIVPGDDFDAAGIPQVVFYGRSNSGKSSTINALLNRNDLAKSSGVPGKTKEANVFSINDKQLYFIDLPGYGYAKTSKSMRDQLYDLIMWFMHETHASVRLNVIILDAKVGLTDYDRDIIKELERTNDPIVVVMNKIDKLNQSDLSKANKALREELPAHIPVIAFSAVKKKNVHKFWEAARTLVRIDAE